ncbi:MAG: 5'-nucleotidase, lipoprotein e(P4) family [Kiloniellales bacterium]
MTDSRPTTGRLYTIATFCAALALAGPAAAEDVPQNDNLNAVLWTQNSPEFKATAIAAYALAMLRLDQALADKSWTAATEQGGDFANLPPAVIVDVDETVLDNSDYQAWMVLNNESFDSKTWNAFVKSETSREVPGALDFAKYADSKGVKVFYVSNRVADEEEATRNNLAEIGFPMGGNVDTVLVKGEKDDWGSPKGTRRATVAKDYRVLLLVGDNFSDFVDDYKGNPIERLAVMDQHKAHWGHDWIMVANPTYGSFESAPFGSNYKLPESERRKMKMDALRAWKP